MRIRILLQLIAGVSLILLPMCEDFDGPMAAGMVQASNPAADRMLQEAREYRKLGKLGKAKSALRTLLSEHPMAPCAAQARFELGDVYAGLKDYREAFKQYGKVVDAYQGSPLYTQALNRQLALATDGASGALKVDMFGGLWKTDMESSVVEEWLKEIISVAPYNDMSATAAATLGRFLVRQGGTSKLEQACDVYTRLVENYPNSRYAPEAQLMVAQLWASSHTRGNNNLVNLHKAQEAYEEFSLRFPNHPDAKKALAEASHVKRLLVQQQLEVGRYYLERSREYRSAVFCLEDVIRQADVNPEAAAEARKLLVEAKRALAHQH